MEETCDKFVKLESLSGEETGVLVAKPLHFGLIRNEQGVFHFSPGDVVEGINVNAMEAGARQLMFDWR